MGILDSIFGRRDDSDSDKVDVQKIRDAQEYMSNGHWALYKHYHVDESKRIIQQFRGIELTDNEAVIAINGLRHQNNMGDIEYYHMPGYSLLDHGDEPGENEGQYYCPQCGGWIDNILDCPH